MDIDLVERLIRLLENSTVNELEVTEGNLHIRLAKSVAVAPASAALAREEAPEATTEPEAAKNGGLHAIVAGLPGTFYRAPAPGAAPFAQVGDRIIDGQQIAIVEAMKMMNPVEADVEGVIEEIRLEDGEPVTAGTVLFYVRKTAP